MNSTVELASYQVHLSILIGDSHIIILIYTFYFIFRLNRIDTSSGDQTDQIFTMSDSLSLPGVTLDGMMGLELKFEDVYKLVKKLRSGSYGTVYTTTHLRSNSEYAVKVIDRT
jgi:hypothetical protein